MSILDDLLIDKVNVIVEAVAGSGKTRTILDLLKYTDNVLICMYNRALSQETNTKISLSQRNYSNVYCSTLHSFVQTYYRVECADDLGLYYIIKNNITPSIVYNFKYFCFDEVQDFKPLYIEVIKKILNNNLSSDYSILLLGDRYQSIYQYNGSTLILMENPEYLSSKEWRRRSLNYSWRCPPHICSIIRKTFNIPIYSSETVDRPNTVHKHLDTVDKECLDTFNEHLDTVDKECLDTFNEHLDTLDKECLDTFNEQLDTLDKECLETVDRPSSETVDEILNTKDKQSSDTFNKHLEIVDRQSSDTKDRESSETLDDRNSKQESLQTTGIVTDNKVQYIIGRVNEFAELIINTIRNYSLSLNEICILTHYIKGNRNLSYLIDLLIKKYRISFEEIPHAILISSIHSMKGKQKNWIFLFGFDSSYDRIFSPNLNLFYVAFSRAKKQLVLLHNQDEDFISFINHELISECSLKYNENEIICEKDIVKKDRQENFLQRLSVEELDYLRCLCLPVILFSNPGIVFETTIEGIDLKNIHTLFFSYLFIGTAKYDNAILYDWYKESTRNMNIYLQFWRIAHYNYCLKTNYFYSLFQLNNYSWFNQQHVLDIISFLQSFYSTLRINNSCFFKTVRFKEQKIGEVFYLDDEKCIIIKYSDVESLFAMDIIYLAFIICIYKLTIGYYILLPKREIIYLTLSVEMQEIFYNKVFKL